MARLTVWPIYVLAGVCFAIAAALIGMYIVLDTQLFSTLGGDEVVVLIPIIIGVEAIRTGRNMRLRVARDPDDADEAEPAARPARARKLRKAKLVAEPPRIGNDPFRDPPARPPILVQHPLPPAPPAPIVPGNPAHAPKLLT